MPIDLGIEGRCLSPRTAVRRWLGVLTRDGVFIKGWPEILFLRSDSEIKLIVCIED